MFQVLKYSISFLCVLSVCGTNASADDSSVQAGRTVYYQALDANLAADFCRDILGMKDIETDGIASSNSQRWLRYGADGVQIHFETVSSDSERNALSSFITALDYDVDAFHDWMHSHLGIWVDDLSPLIERLQSTNTSFLGPIKRADDLYQIYVRVEGVGYLEFDTLTIPEDEYLPLVKDWETQWSQSKPDAEKTIQKTDAHGGKAGTTFDSVTDGWLEGEKILAISVNWDSYLHGIELVYDSYFAVSYGQPVGGKLDTMSLEDDEYITNAIVCTKTIEDSNNSNAKVVSFVKFFTNKGQQKHFGQSSDDCYYMLYNGENEVLGIHGKASNRIDSLGLSFRSLKPTP